MAAKFSPIGNDVMISSTTGLVADSYKLFFYQAGTSTKQNTYTTQAASVANSNPIVLSQYGKSTNQIWLTEGQTYKVVMAPADDTDPPASGVTLGDNISGVNDLGTGTGIEQWTASGLTPTYISATSFSFAGDQTTVFQANRRIKSTVTGGTAYSTIATSSYSNPTTTITVVNDSTALDSGLSAVSYSILSSTNPALPNLEGVVGVTTTPYVLLSANNGKAHYLSSSAAAVTTPAIAGVSVGNRYTLTNQLATGIVISRDGSSVFSGYSPSTTTIYLGGYSSVTLTKYDATTWAVSNLIQGSAQKRVLASGSFTVAASLQFVLSTLDPIQSVTNAYEIDMLGFQPETDDVILQSTVSSDAGSTYVATGYYSAVRGLDSAGAASNTVNQNGSVIRVAGEGAGESLSNVSGEVAYSNLKLKGFNTGTSTRGHMQIEGGYWKATIDYSAQAGAGSQVVAADYDAVKFTWGGGGNFAAVGTYVLYKTA